MEAKHEQAHLFAIIAECRNNPVERRAWHLSNKARSSHVLTRLGKPARVALNNMVAAMPEAGATLKGHEPRLG